MALEKNWYNIDEAVTKFGVERERILEWVADGVVRSEESGGKVVRVNSDDLGLKVQELTGI